MSFPHLTASSAFSDTYTHFGSTPADDNYAIQTRRNLRDANEDAGLGVSGCGTHSWSSHDRRLATLYISRPSNRAGCIKYQRTNTAPVLGQQQLAFFKN